MDAWAGGSDGRKAPSATADEAGTRGRHGEGQEKGMKKEAGRVGKEQNHWECGETLGAAKSPEWNPRSTEWDRRRVTVRPPEWRKPSGGDDKEWGGGGSSCLWTTRPATERVGGSNRPRTTQPPTEG